MSDVDAGLPVGSCTCRPQVRLIHSMPCVLISRRMSREPPCRTSKTLFICQAKRTHSSGDGGNSGPPGQGLNDAAPLTADRAHPSQHDEHTVELRFEPSLTGRPKTHTSGRWGLPMHAKPLPQSS
ncbi:hypothetical protein G5714_004391 [Onychostoma macrolepis]|uniref:Uncharacterized protein n=1 Tax=Onychostoma macrolepis TaxID=369639 RepID=A0A7J6D4K5_9TELE|nr:hypothetical protein G5714_004391 [Onychostoma macrolepis]